MNQHNNFNENIDRLRIEKCQKKKGKIDKLDFVILLIIALAITFFLKRI